MHVLYKGRQGPNVFNIWQHWWNYLIISVRARHFAVRPLLWLHTSGKHMAMFSIYYMWVLVSTWGTWSQIFDFHRLFVLYKNFSIFNTCSVRYIFSFSNIKFHCTCKPYNIYVHKTFWYIKLYIFHIFLYKCVNKYVGKLLDH